MKVDQQDQDRAICYHEAAHAVFAVEVCGGDLRYVDADEGYCAYRFRNSGGWADSWREVMYVMAGWCAEQVANYGEIRPKPWELFAELELVYEADHGDCSDLMECLRKMGDPEEKYRTVIVDVEQQVRERWPQIAAAAEALMVMRRLEGDEVALIIESVHKREEWRDQEERDH